MHSGEQLVETLRICMLISKRHWVVYRKDLFANMIPTLSDPAFFILALGFGLGAYVSDLDGRSYVHFIAPGLAISTALFTSFFETSYNFYIRYTYEGIYKAMLTTPIGVREIILGEFIWVALKGAFMASCVTAVLLALNVVSWQFIWIIPFLGGLVAISCGSLGLIAAATVRNINQFQTVYTLLISPMFFFSGLFFPLHDLPRAFQFIAYLSPLTHGVRMGQAVLWNENALVTVATHTPILITMSLFFGWIAYNRAHRKLYN